MKNIHVISINLHGRAALLDLLFNKLSLCPYMVGKPSISIIRTWRISSDIRRWPYLEVHCSSVFTACSGGHFEKRGNFSSVLRKFVHPERNFPRLNALKKSTSICFNLQGYPEVDLEFLMWELNRQNAIASEAETRLLTESCKVKKILIQRKRTYSR